MPPAKKRKTRAAAERAEKSNDGPDISKADSALPQQEPVSAAPTTPTQTEPSSASSAADAAAKAKERAERFKALQARAKTGAQKNLKEATLESQRLATDPNLLTSLNRKATIAQHNLMKADAEVAGEDFERKRAWDWTIDESEKWDKRLKKKDAHRDDQAFQDYRQDSRKVYKRQLRNLKPDMDNYEKEKMKAVEKAAASGGLEIVETDDGELVAVDKDGTFYSTADSTGFVEHKPPKDAIDRLVKDLQQAEEARLKKRRERMGQSDDGDVTYINEKNKTFNQKLARFYNKYTAEIRDSFERGTMI
ncbi:SYF2-domain-containing protein [Venustampulla echinocandica]|uniref:Pre-mRNA-splicing factor SYF2 n=1 Tax=Venustampulla echinocandica TaxID=2656787 RepID=A0A370TPG7_9HELO|nr:SYF2-domain-containing protein [Venustampulla echinocandica]RDL37415.1 SYF2-domain-containing protein [Venustampulla echinocandica]